VVFFFSSRRRHTRSYGDWSSDVCSSDLEVLQAQPAARGGTTLLPALARPGNLAQPVKPLTPFVRKHETSPSGVYARCSSNRTDRSEERRVGKEGRSRRSRVDDKEKRRRR